MLKPFFENELGKIYCGRALDILKQLPKESVQCVITSPPYWGLRDYNLEPIIWDDHNGCEHNFLATLNPKGNGTDTTFRRDRKAGQKRDGHQLGFCIYCNAWCGSLGLEPTYELYISHIIQIFKEVKRVLKKNGTLWLNIGDSYAGSGQGWSKLPNKQSTNKGTLRYIYNRPPGYISSKQSSGIKPKDLIGIPWRIAFALQANGWYLRSDIIWHKPNCMPESVKDRPTRNFDYIFLLTKSQKYYYDWEAIKELASYDTHARYSRGRSNDHKYANGGSGNQKIAKSFEHMRQPGVNPKARKIYENKYPRAKQNPSFSSAVKDIVEFRNKRSVWTIPTKAFSGSHFATFPEKLVEPCILAGSKKGDIVLDPFAGSCTVAVVAAKAGRKFICIDLSKEYCEMGLKRIKKETRQKILF